MADVYTDSKGKPDPEVLKSHFIREGRVEEEVALRIIQQGEVVLQACVCWCVCGGPGEEVEEEVRIRLHY